MAKTKHKYPGKGKKKGGKKRGKAKKAKTKRKNVKRRAAPKSARKKRRVKHAYHRGVIGGWYDEGLRRVKKPKRRPKKAKPKKAKKTKHAYAGKRTHNTGFAKCGRCHRIIFGGTKGMGTHRRKRHRGRR